MKTQSNASVFELNGIPKFGQALPLALQHVVAMIVGCVTPAIIISGVAGVSEADKILLIQTSLVASALSTVVVKHFCNTLFENSPGISSFKWCFPIIVGMRTDMIVPYVHISV